METGRREKAQCQSGQLDGNKAVADSDAVDPHAEKSTLSFFPSPFLSFTLEYTHTQCTYREKCTHPHTYSNWLGHG